MSARARRFRPALLALGLLAACDEAEPVFPDGPLPALDAGLDASLDAAPACAPVTGAGTTHNSNLAAPETWTAAASPHLIPFDTTVSATITIEACAVVRIGADKTVSVRAGGALVATGSADQPVRFERLVANDSWASIRTLGGGTLSLTGTILDGGGQPLATTPQLASVLDIASTAPQVVGVLHAVGLRITGSEGNGISLHDGGGFDATSSDVTITGSAAAPILSFASALGTIPAGTYTGNVLDEIVIPANGSLIASDVTLRARGVPYRLGLATQSAATLDVAATAGVATLTIEPGVTVRFGAAGRLRIDPAASTTPARGALIAVGTAAQPIVFTSTSATPAAGDWQGVWLGGAIDAATRIQHARVAYAGGASVSGSDSCMYTGQVGPNDAAIRVLGPTAAAFITDTEIVSSARHGIDRGFRSDTKPDFMPSNTFTSVPGCRQTYPRDISGACPTSVPCP